MDYDEDKIRVAQRTAPEHPRIRFESGDILERDYPACDTMLLLDVLHYWTPEKQQLILNQARRGVASRRTVGAARRRAGGERSASPGASLGEIRHARGHEPHAGRAAFSDAGGVGGMLQRAGFAGWEIKREAGRDSNVMLVARV